MKVVYQRSNYKFYAKSILLITLVIFLIALVLELLNLTLDEKPFKNDRLVTIINWSTFLIFAIMSFCVRKALWVQKLVCPFLTIYIFLLVI